MESERRLYVLRHAKSSWDDPGLDDHDRPLAPRGRRAAAALAAHIVEAEIAPQLVLCSTSRRTRETLDGVQPPGAVEIEPELYGASGAALIERLRRVSPATSAVMLIGHNPGLQMLVLKLAAPTPGAAHRSEIERKFPTGALATLSFDGAWSELSPGKARLDAYVRPKALAGY